MFRWVLILTLAVRAGAQTICAGVSAFAVCDIPFAVPPNQDAELNAEFRGPSHRTFLVRAWRAAPDRMILRFSPSEPGEWTVRYSSTLPEYHDKELTFTVAASDSPGWVEAGNLQHFRNSTGARGGHLWLGDTAPESLDGAALDGWVAARAAAGVTHVRIAVPNSMDAVAWDRFDARAAAINRRNLIADLVLTPPNNADRAARQKFFSYVVDRAAARNATWIILDRFENYRDARDLVREISAYLDADSYHHVRTVGAAATSGTFADDRLNDRRWLGARWYGSQDWRISAVENQVFPTPAVSVVSGASAEEFRHNLWNQTMSGTYPEAEATDAQSVQYLKVWHDVFQDTRHWELQPYFDLDNGRALALELTEYVVYVEHPGTVTVQLDQKHKWNVKWINPLNGEAQVEKPPKSDVFSGEPPDSSHDWVLYIDREGHKESLKSYYFESRKVVLQDVEADPDKVPFTISSPPDAATLKVSQPVNLGAKLKKETKATKKMVWLWTVEVTADEQGYRTLGTAASDSVRIPGDLARHFPATAHIRLYGLNGYGKLYSVDENYGLEP